MLPLATYVLAMRGELLEAARVYSIVGGFYAVYNDLGYGLNEAAYTRALQYELMERGHRIVRELAVDVRYKGRHVAWQRLDMVVDNVVIVETKASERLSPAAQRQLISYLRAGPFEVGVLLHFGPSPKFYRYVDFPKRDHVPGRAVSQDSVRPPATPERDRATS